MNSGTERLVWISWAEPTVILCPDETDDGTTRVCHQIDDSLFAFKPGRAALVPQLAVDGNTNPDATE
ncbi:MAG: hypothetical protein M1281_13710 [Chloroflexi bacterium]|nr:hypothetical protein [Chloroflexota bacterium]MCL4561656.1 hypothetical protein [Chloroflexota bacterium]